MTRKVRRSAHCIQLIEPRDIRRRTPKFIRPLPDDDSSVDGDSSGDESASKARLEELGRAGYEESLNEDNSEEAKNRRRRRRDRIRARRKETRQREIREHNRQKDPDEPRRDLIVLEYMENGDLDTFIIIRACVAMEYPPRKFHPDRKEPKPNVSKVAATRSRMRRELTGLGITLVDPANQTDLQNRTERYNLLGNDMIENIPNFLNVLRRQNMVHFDIDPMNVLIGDLECTPEGEEEWRQTRLAAEKAAANRGGADAFKPLRTKRKRDDRATCEHEFVPRLKLADFGLAEKIKRGKRNDYYFKRRARGKHGFYAPEQFGHEWEYMPGDPDGREISESLIAGYYGPQTNIWGIAYTMWMVITQCLPPTPPQPQVPDVDNYDPTGRTYAQIDRDFYLTGEDPPVSYGVLLMDNEFGWADHALRERIYQCLYHRPGDRPTLPQLLREAASKLCHDSFPNESDEEIRAWVHKWIYEPPMPRGNNDNAPPPPPPQPPPPPPQPILQQLPPQQLQLEPLPPPNADASADDITAFRNDFPNGCHAIPNGVGLGLRGLTAVVDSLMAQVQNMTNSAGRVILYPDYNALFEIYRELRANGRFAYNNSTNAQLGLGQNHGPRLEDEIAITLQEWARREGLVFNLGVIEPYGDHRRLFVLRPPDRVIWIWHGENGWEGVTPALPRPTAGGGDASAGPGDGSGGHNLQYLPSLSAIPPADVSAPRQGAAAFAASFPGGAVQIPNRVRMGQCGLVALIDSLRAQLGPNPIVTATGAPIVIPTYDDLLQLYRNMRANGVFSSILVQAPQANEAPNAGPYQPEELAMVLREWGRQYGLLLDLGLLVPNGGHNLVQQTVAGTQTIWIFNPGGTWRGVMSNPDIGHIRYNFRFPYGFVRTGAPQPRYDQMGTEAIRSSIMFQLNRNQIPRGIFPSFNDILMYYQRWIANGRDPVAAGASDNPPSWTPGPGPTTVDEMAGTLFTWAAAMGLNLDLGVSMANQPTAPYVVFSGRPNTSTIWIYFEDNRWGGMIPSRRPSPPLNSNDSLPDYVSGEV
ncbi:hypothetical protein F4818DRAFT_442364 [Hypoxylon cercidicola]|nr:hypothetical protein F4818DRAFT_442364 [Hypoxylon cercidicola]